MAASALVLGALGIAATFGPYEFLAHVGAEPRPGLVLVVQAAGALYLGFASLNWMAKGSLIGGIYGKPVAIGNLTHFTVLTFAFLRVILDGTAPPMLIVVTFIYALFAVWFATVAFGVRT